MKVKMHAQGDARSEFRTKPDKYGKLYNKGLARGMSDQGKLHRRSQYTLSVLFLLVSGVLSSAQDSSTPAPPGESRFLPWEKGSVKLGGFVSTFDSTLTFSRSSGS